MYTEAKTVNQRSLEKEDKVNLAQIEKRYIKQTQKLIEKDKEIYVQLANYHR